MNVLVKLCSGGDGGPPVVCFPPAGCGSGWFRPLASALGPGTEVYAVELPGHGRRLREAPLADARAVLDEVTAALDELIGGPCVLFGHSMGGLIAYETARAISDPSLLVVSGCQAPSLRSALPRRHELSDDALVASMVDLGAAAEPFEVEELRRIVLPLLRADLRLVETWPLVERPPIEIPILVLAGTQDPDAPPRDAVAWAAETTARCEVVALDGDHFFPERQPQEIAALLRTARSAV
ncbi:thioesterase II family protein [Lentzea sp.]|uniref:thioesterase II family protein n=1 Tax=Lentzea sp. TaxID=56099 RepID=UPI002BC2E835|nr:alpha/beta fold hydrolase [Lentzea sp.]HUQ55572.1 alpha/beta fold hydrolase [Lentzea sp.]